MKLGKFIITRERLGVPAETLENVDAEYEKGLQTGKKLILCVLAGRSGTRWLGDVFNAHENATGITERYFEAESMYRYIKYNKLPIDTSGIITLIKHGIVEDWKKTDISFVNSPFFSHGIKELVETLKPERIVFALNDPKFTVQSMYNKGFFEHYYIRNRNDLALGFQPSFPQQWYWLYLFARLVPNGDFYTTWQNLTRIGKIAWWGNMVNVDIWEQLKVLPTEKVFIFHLKEAEQNYEYYKNLANDFGLEPQLSVDTFLAIRGKSVRTSHNAGHEWSDKEIDEFNMHTKKWYELYSQLCLHKK